MVTIKIKGYEVNAVPIRDSFNRRAQQLQNKIFKSLSLIDLTEDDIELELEKVPIKRAPASISWYIDGQHLHFSYKGCDKYIDNLFVISKVIEFEVASVLNGKKTMLEFIQDFSEKHDVAKERLEARELLGVPPDCLDLTLISKKYKDMAKELHPDMDSGDIDKFKAINHAHKILKRELE